MPSFGRCFQGLVTKAKELKDSSILALQLRRDCEFTSRRGSACHPTFGKPGREVSSKPRFSRLNPARVVGDEGETRPMVTVYTCDQPDLLEGLAGCRVPVRVIADRDQSLASISCNGNRCSKWYELE